MYPGMNFTSMVFRIASARSADSGLSRVRTPVPSSTTSRCSKKANYQQIRDKSSHLSSYLLLGDVSLLLLDGVSLLLLDGVSLLIVGVVSFAGALRRTRPRG